MYVLITMPGKLRFSIQLQNMNGFKNVVQRSFDKPYRLRARSNLSILLLNLFRNWNPLLTGYYFFKLLIKNLGVDICECMLKIDCCSKTVNVT